MSAADYAPPVTITVTDDGGIVTLKGITYATFPPEGDIYDTINKAVGTIARTYCKPVIAIAHSPEGTHTLIYSADGGINAADEETLKDAEVSIADYPPLPTHEAPAPPLTLEAHEALLLPHAPLLAETHEAPLTSPFPWSTPTEDQHILLTLPNTENERGAATDEHSVTAFAPHAPFTPDAQLPQPAPEPVFLLPQPVQLEPPIDPFLSPAPFENLTPSVPGEFFAEEPAAQPLPHPSPRKGRSVSVRAVALFVGASTLILGGSVFAWLSLSTVEGEAQQSRLVQQPQSLPVVRVKPDHAQSAQSGQRAHTTPTQPQTEAKKNEAEEPASAPQPAPAATSTETEPAPSPQPDPAPTHQPAPAPQPAPDYGLTDLQTSVSTSGGGRVEATFYLSGQGSVTATISVGGRSATVSATAPGSVTAVVTGVPLGSQSWTASADGLVNSGTVTVY